MSSLKFTSSFPCSQNNQNGSFWKPTSPLVPHNRRRSEHLPRTMANALGTIPVPNFSFDGKKPPRITSPLSNVKPIGFERGISRQMGYSSFSISEVGEDMHSAEEESGDNIPIITQSLIRGMYPVKHGASNSMQEDDMSFLDLGTSVVGLNVNENSSPSKGTSYGELQSYLPYTQAREQTGDMGMHPSNVATGHRVVTAIFRGPQVQSSLPSNSGARYAPASNIEPLGHRAVAYQHNRSASSVGGSVQYMPQFNAQVAGNPSTIDGDYASNSHMQTNSFVYQQDNEIPYSLGTPFKNPHLGAYSAQYTSNATSASVSSAVGQTLDRSGTSFQSGMRPTDQLLREQRLLAPLPSNITSASHYLGTNNDRDTSHKFEGEANLPNDLNCAVWIQGIPRGFERQFLYQELFQLVSIGPIIAAWICLGGDQHPHHAAKVVFKHAEHATRLRQQAILQGIYIHGNRLRVEPNRHGQREYPLRLHYRSRVILLEVFNHPSMDPAFWKMYIYNLCVYDMENCRHLSYSSPRRMVMEFRFARIFGQASVLLAGIRANVAFEGIVTARYAPDVRCDVCETY